ncbi:MAG: HEAT repeat domain-containing protein [Planctomycetaceae bacterium]
MRTLWTLVLIVALSVADDEPSPPPEPKPRLAGEVEVGETGVKIEDPAVARDKIARFQSAYKEADEDTAKAELVKKLGDWDHPEILKTLAKMIGDRNRFAAIEAALGCARQSDPGKAGAALHRALLSEKRIDVACALLVALGRTGYVKASKDAEKWFKKDSAEGRKAAARYFGGVKAKEAFRLLAEELDEPKPGRIDDPKNPPASWWKVRWEEWDSNLPYVKKALSEIVPGETFDTRKEAEEWARVEGRKHGIEW